MKYYSSIVWSEEVLLIFSTIFTEELFAIAKRRSFVCLLEG